MASRIFRAKWYYSLAGTVLPLLSALVWAFYSIMLYYHTLYAGISLEPFDILFYGLVTLLCVCFALAGLLMGWQSKVMIVVWDDRITWVRKKVRVELKYAEITDIRYASLFQLTGIKLLSKKGSIRIFKDINGFNELYEILRQKVSAIAAAENEPLPERVWATNEVPVDMVGAVALTIAAIPLGIAALLVSSVTQAVFFAIIAIVMLGFGASRLYRWLNRPYAFFFAPMEIRARTLFKEEEIPRMFIKEIRLGTAFRNAEYVKVPVKAVFIESLDGRTFIIEETGSRYPAERLYGMLRRAYGK
jgi:hypothetical protein